MERSGPALPAALALACALSAAGLARAAEEEERDLTRLSVEQLAAIEVVTVSRRPEARVHAAGAVHVVTAEDVRRSGATTLPDALRLAPGLQASVIDANEWALAVRGFASRLSRSVLVLMDGRSLWTPLFAGVFWDAQDAMLEDLDRMEVVRGPGGALFGANALNGVVNIISKDSAATQGGLLTLGGGSAERYANLRWGDEFSTHTTYRVYGRYLDRDGTEALTASAYDDSWRMLRGGARLDTRLGSRDALTLRADGYDARSRLRTQAASFTPPFARDLEGPVRLRGGDVTAEWRYGFAGGSDAWLRAYYDEARRTEPHYTFRRHTLDLEGQHRFAWGGRHETTWGASYRVSHGVFGGSPTLQIVPAARNDDIAGLFLHNETQLWGERLRLIAGSKLEWNDYSGWNVQPSARVAWRPAARHTLWAAAARAVRTTSRLERDILLYTSLSPTQPLFARLQGNPDFQPERVLAWEAGYKAQPVAALFVDVAGFHSTYDRLASSEAAAPVVEPGRPPEPARVVVPVRIDNLQEGSASGVEAAITATVGPRWRVQGAWSFLRVNQRPRPGSTDRNEGFEGTSPRHQVWAASYLTLARGLDLDLVFRRLGRIETHGVPAFSELDARLALRPLADLELAAVGKNLLHERHVEFGGGFAVERSLLVRATFEW